MQHTIDLLIHINETLDAGEQAALEKELHKTKGVTMPRFNKETPHLLLVSYIPHEINSNNLLGRVISNGYNAQLIGL